MICNDTIAASGVFTAKELCRLSKGETDFFWPHATRGENGRETPFFVLVAASIMSGSSGMHGGGGGINGIKLEGSSSSAGTGGGGGGGGGGSNNGSSYYCNSYTPPAQVEHGLLSAYSECRCSDFFASSFAPVDLFSSFWAPPCTSFFLSLLLLCVGGDHHHHHPHHPHHMIKTEAADAATLHGMSSRLLSSSGRPLSTESPGNCHDSQNI